MTAPSSASLGWRIILGSGGRRSGQASWIAAYSTINLTRQFGTAVNHAFLTDPTAGSPLLLGRPLYEASELDGTINAGAFGMLNVT
jgi:predicted phage gp36 major capsid-like protein